MIRPLRGYLPWLVAAALVAATVFAATGRRDDRVLADTIGVTQYPGGVAMVQIPFRRDANPGTVTVSVDDAVVIQRAPLYPTEYWNDDYFFRPSVPLAGRVRVRVVMDGGQGESVTRDVVVSRSTDRGIADDLTDVTQPARSMKTGEADLPERRGECAPTAAADALIRLTKEHGADDRLPPDTVALVDELKQDMRWTPGDGVNPDGYVAGISHWALALGLPVRVSAIGDAAGHTTLDDLAHALAAGDAAQSRLQFSDGSVPVGGHLVGVVAVSRSDDGDFIAVNDPRSVSGTDIYRIRNGRLTDYPFFDKDVTLGVGFTEEWVDTNARMELTSTAFTDGASIPPQYACGGAGTPPPLEVTGVPDGTASLTLTVTDPDAPRGTFIHWTKHGIAPDASDLRGGTEGLTSTGRKGWVPPCPPSGTHHYVFTVSALDATGAILATATLTGLYSRDR